MSAATFKDEKYDGQDASVVPYDAPSLTAGSKEQDAILSEEAIREEEEHSTHRGLKGRQLSMIAIGGAIGSGLIIGSGSALAKSGPVGLLLGYSIVGAICFTVMTALGEMCTQFPDKRGFPGYAARFVDPALGFACAVDYLAKYFIVSPNQIVACVIAIQYWDGKKVNPAIYCVVIMVVIVLINGSVIQAFGEVEFAMSTIKVITLTGLIILGLAIDLGVGAEGRLGFRYWKNPGPFAQYIGKGAWGEFLGFWYAVPNALFAYIGTELIGVTVGEAKNPRKNIPRAIKGTFWRIIIFYIGLIWLVGLIVPYNSKVLAAANKSAANANASPFVIAIQLAGIKVLPSILNACILLFVFSAANSDVYVGSRTLFQMACQRQAPQIFKRTNKRGVPYVALATQLLFTCLCFVVCSSEALTIFRYFTSLISLLGALTWMTLLISHIRFKKAMAVQNFDQSQLSYKAPLGKIGSWVALVATTIITIFKGFDSVAPTFQYKSFITNYIGIVLAVLAYSSWKIYHKTKLIPLAEVDLVSGTRMFEEEDKVDVEYAPGWKGKLKSFGSKLAG